MIDGAPPAGGAPAEPPEPEAPSRLRQAVAAIRARLRIRIARPSARAARLVTTVRSMPRRRQALLAGSAVVSLALAACLVVLGATAVSALSAQFGFHPREEAASWAALKPRFAVTGSCANCHTPEGLKWSVSKHDVVPCQSCHGPLEGHDATGVVAAAALDELQSRELCAACHAQAVGRPARIAQVDTSTHFTPGGCALCHDPHTTSPVRPPRIPHPLVNLPDCSVCHGSAGLRPVPATHPIFPSDVCRKCHVLLPSEQLTPVS